MKIKELKKMVIKELNYNKTEIFNSELPEQEVIRILDKTTENYCSRPVYNYLEGICSQWLNENA